MKKSDELRQQMTELKAKVKADLTNLTEDEALNKANEIESLQKQIDAAEKIENAIKEDIATQVANGVTQVLDGGDNVVNIKDAFAKAIFNKDMSAEEIEEIKNLVVEGDRGKGGVTVPQDIVTDIRVYQDSTRMWDIRPYITVEPVGTMSGSRPYASNIPQASGFAPVEEGKDIQALYEPAFDELKYLITKYAGYIPVSNELLADGTGNIYNYLVKWLAENELNTYAYQIFNGTGSKSAQGLLTEIAKEITKAGSSFLPNRVEVLTSVPTIDKFKKVFNVDLESVTGDNVVIFTNADGYQYLDTLKDKQDRCYLQPDATKKSGFTFLGREIVKVPKKFLPTDSTSGTPFIIGDLRQLYTMFDRQLMSVQSTNIGGDSWRKDLTEIKGVFRFDGKIKIDCTSAIKVLYSKLS